MRTHRGRNQAMVLSGILAVGLMWSAPSQAAIELTELLVDGATLAAGDNLIFENFTYSSTNNMPSPAGVLVEPYQDFFGNWGIRVSGGFTDAAGGGASTLELGYRVSAVDGMGILGAGISAATLAGNPVAIGEGSFTITEAFEGIPTTLTIFDQAPGTTKLLDSIDLPSILSSLNVQLSVEANALSGGATASFIDQTFDVDVVPEPASFVIWLGTLAVFGLVPLTYRRWWPAPQPAYVGRASR
jgi:hypothetical protein